MIILLLIWVCNVCPDLSVQKLRIITVHVKYSAWFKNYDLEKKFCQVQISHKSRKQVIML